MGSNRQCLAAPAVCSGGHARRRRPLNVAISTGLIAHKRVELQQGTEQDKHLLRISVNGPGPGAELPCLGHLDVERLGHLFAEYIGLLTDLLLICLPPGRNRLRGQGNLS